MPEPLTPYDAGYRLEPKPWVKEGTASPGGLPRQAVADDYGRVDFEDDEGATVFTAWFQKTESGGYILRVDEHQDVELTIETSSQRQPREGAMMRLDNEIRVLAAQYASVVTLSEEDPDAFGAGHYVIENRAGTWRFTITERFTGTDSSDPERIPTGWTYESESAVASTVPSGWDPVAHGEYGSEDVGRLIGLTQDWMHERLRDTFTELPQSLSQAPLPRQPGMTY